MKNCRFPIINLNGSLQFVINMKLQIGNSKKGQKKALSFGKKYNRITEIKKNLNFV